MIRWLTRLLRSLAIELGICRPVWLEEPLWPEDRK